MNQAWIGRAGLLTCLAVGVAYAESPPLRMSLREELQTLIHIGRFTAVGRVKQAEPELAAERYEQAAEWLQRAVDEDPLLVPAWSALAAAQLGRCRLLEARFAAQQAALLNPEESIPRGQLRAIREATCAAVPPDSALPAEIALLTQSQQPDLWWRSALERAARQEWWPALYRAARAESEGYAGAAIRPQVAQWLIRAGQFDAARRLSREHAEQTLEAEIEAARSAIASVVADLRQELVPLLATRPEINSDRLVALLESLVASTPSLEREARIEIVCEALDLLRPGRQRFEAGEFDLPAGWSRTAPVHSGGALLHLVLWPGDTWLRWFAAPHYEQIEAAQAWLHSKLPSEATLATSPWLDCASTRQPGRCFDFEIELSSGRRLQARWFALDLLRDVVRVRSIGTGGCGAACAEQFAQAADRIESELNWSHGKAWRDHQLQSPWDLDVATTTPSAAISEETHEPWRTFPLGNAWQVDLPPGVVAIDHDPFTPSNSTLAGIWWRGRFRDREGLLVQVGDAERLARIVISDSALPNQLDPIGEVISRASLDSVLQQVGSRFRGTVVRSRDAQAALEWLTFALSSAAGQVRMQIPVRDGARSLSLLWIALTLRAAGESGPPPIVELGSRGAVRLLKPAKTASAADPREGVLTSDSFEVAIPKGFQIALNPNSEDGFPVLARNKQRAELRFERAVSNPVSATQAAALVRTQLALDPSLSVQESTRGRTKLISVESENSAGRQAAILAGYSQSGSVVPVVLVRLTAPHDVPASSWRHLVGIVRDTIKVATIRAAGAKN